jgi:cell division protein FtsQ
MAESYLQVTNQLKGIPVEVSELIEDSRGAWRLKLKGGIEVLLGNKDQEQRLARFKVAYNQALGTNAKLIRRVDLRYTNGLAVEWKQSQLSSL